MSYLKSALSDEVLLSISGKYYTHNQPLIMTCFFRTVSVPGKCDSYSFSSTDGSTAVHRACHDGHHEALQILIEYEAALSVQDTQGRAPIHWACAAKDRGCLRVRH